MAHAGTNVRNVHASMSHSEMDSWMMKIPESIRRWMEYEAVTPYNPRQLVEIQAEMKMKWSDVWQHMVQESRKDHASSFGGVYPGGYKNDRKTVDAIAAMKRTERPSQQELWDAFMRS